MTKLQWKKDWGDGYETDDSVLWINGKPTNNYISGWSGCWWVYLNGEEIEITTTLKYAKQMILERLELGE